MSRYGKVREWKLTEKEGYVQLQLQNEENHTLIDFGLEYPDYEKLYTALRIYFGDISE